MKNKRTEEEKIDVYISFLEHIINTGDFEYLMLAIDKEFITEITYSFIIELIRVNKPKQNKCALFCLQNFHNRINIDNIHIIKHFIRFSDNIGNYKIKRFLKDSYSKYE